ncbi:3-hydroxyacyl-CoA dehydrogenase family protein [Asaia bogorensis]|uniref:3-hydroxyacyl-CoA dehydrogenase family protein n=1 Tax=Asaia bogorensis TaxID=91915 RepID=UPI00285FE7E9|nr:3-hydroxyacyl-CoA dehydrogenase family protein [Asaia bogorensis]MDR6181403.1 3-hydroxybutyryl-CoA dehydrogenase [Asaia bogorensis NBRC 16594]
MTTSAKSSPTTPSPFNALALSRPSAVIGAGTLGRRIALMLASNGGHVRLFDKNPATLQSGVTFAREALPGLVATRAAASPGEVEAAETLDTALDEAWLVVEALPEVLDLKKEIFGTLSDDAPADAILATNSSSYPARCMIGAVADPSRVLNMHFMMPPEQRAVELMSCGVTREGLLQDMAAYLTTLGLSPYIAEKESIGFIENRIWAAIKREALCVAAEGIASPEVIDRLYCETQGTPMGPFRAMDRVGLDIVLQIEEHYASAFPTLPQAPRQLLRRMIAEKRLGVKSGRGFYDYTSKEHAS